MSFEASTLDASGAARTATVRDGAPIGQVLGDYELLEKLGAGGMGVVYRARQRSANRIVALKLIRPERLAELEPERRQQWLDRFQAEAQATARLQHEHIVTVYEVGSLDGMPFYSMRYVEGRTLAEVVREGPLENRRAAAVLEPVARAVDHAHRAGILHRDLKPRNIMVDSIDRAFVTDFGLVKWLKEESRGVTQTGQVMGTPEYMSPEQARDSSQVTAASDLYSLGAALYDLLTGRPPFQAASSVETLRQVMDEEPVAPRELNPAIDRDLETITLKCLAKEPARRYASASDLVDDLRRYLNGEPILARPLFLPERAWRWSRRHPSASAAIAAVLLAALTLAGAVVVVSYQKQQLATTNEQLSKSIAAQQQATQDAKTSATKAELNAVVAREQSQLALKSLESVIFDIQAKLQNVPGAGDLQRALLQTALARLQEVSDQFASRRSIDRNTMLALGALGDVFLRIGSGTPGGADSDGPLTAARRVYQQKFDIAQQLAAADTSNAHAQRDLSIAYDELGNVQLQSGQVTEALGSYQKGLEISHHLAAADPSDAQAQRDLSVSYDRLGTVQLQTGQVTEALETCQKGLKTRQQLVAADPSDARAQRELSVSYNNLGDVLFQSGQVTEALGHFQKAFEIKQKLAAADPSDSKAQSDLAGSYARLGDVQLQSGQVTEALGSCQKVLEIDQKLVAADPSDARAQRELSVSYNKLGNVQLQSGQLTEALGSYQKGLEISQKLAAADPSDARALRDLFVSYTHLGNVLLRSGQVSEALGYYQKELEISQKLAAADPSDAQAQRDLFIAYNKLGFVLLQSGQVTKALEYCQQGLEISQKLAATDPSNAQAQTDLRESLVVLALARAQLGERQEAAGAAEKLRQLAPKDGRNLYNVACVFSLCATGIKAEREELTVEQAAERQKYITQALENLREAIKVGYNNFTQIREDADLTVLRDLPEFKALLPN